MATGGMWISVAGWDGGTLEVDPSGYTAETFAASTNVADVVRKSGAATVYEVAEAFVTWANSPFRNWTGAVTFSWTPFAAGTRWRVRLVATVACDWTAAGSMVTLAALPASQLGAASVSSGDVPSTLCADLAVTDWIQWRRRKGVASASGSWVPGVTGAEQYPAGIAAPLTHAEAATWGLMWDAAGHTREARVYHHAVDVWRRVNLGEPSLEPIDSVLYQARVPATGFEV